jgi:hypothetical protein
VSRELPADAGLSKLNSMLVLLRPGLRRAPQVVRATGETTAIQPGSVDMLGPIRFDTAVPRGLGGRANLSRERPWIGAPLGAP